MLLQQEKRRLISRGWAKVVVNCCVMIIGLFRQICQGFEGGITMSDVKRAEYKLCCMFANRRAK